MKSPISTSAFVFLTLTSAVWAGLPKKAPAHWDARLLADSPFTSKPVGPQPPDDPNPLDHYALLGVSPIENGGYRVTLVHKDKPSERIIVDTNKSQDGLKILDVVRVSGDPQATVVRMQLGTRTGTIGFDQNLIAAKKPIPAPKEQPPANVPTPRSRVVQPPR